MVQDRVHVLQFGAGGELLQVTHVALRQRAGEVSIRVEINFVHEVGHNARADLLAQLAEDVKSAIVEVGPQVDGGLVGDEAQHTPKGGERIAKDAHDRKGE